LKHQNDLTVVELRSQLLSETGIDITERRVQQILKDLGIGPKKEKHSFMRMLIFQSINKEPKILSILMIQMLATKIQKEYRPLLLVALTNRVLLEKGFNLNTQYKFPIGCVRLFHVLFLKDCKIIYILSLKVCKKIFSFILESL
jgi:hypothetical protein